MDETPSDETAKTETTQIMRLNESNDGPAEPTIVAEATKEDEIYQYYKESLIPAILSSLPLLWMQVKADLMYYAHKSLMGLMHFLLPWTKEDFDWHPPQIPTILNQKWIHGNITQFIQSLDKDKDGKLPQPHTFSIMIRVLLLVPLSYIPGDL